MRRTSELVRFNGEAVGGMGDHGVVGRSVRIDHTQQVVVADDRLVLAVVDDLAQRRAAIRAFGEFQLQPGGIARDAVGIDDVIADVAGEADIRVVGGGDDARGFAVCTLSQTGLEGNPVRSSGLRGRWCCGRR